MALPNNTLASTPVPAVLLTPDQLVRTDLTVDYELGGVAVGDASQGVRVRSWRAWTDGASIYVAPYPEGAPATKVLDAAGVTELSLAFDQLMRPVVVFVQGGVTKLNWFDTLANQQVTTPIAGAKSPMVCTDDKRPQSIGSGLADVLLVYVTPTRALAYRQQRDRFGVERILAPTLPDRLGRIVSCGMGANGRVQIAFSTTPALYADLSTDSIYLVTSTNDVAPANSGTPTTGRWVSRTFKFDSQPTMGWGRVEANAYPVTLKVWGDGKAVMDGPVASDVPFRLRPVRAREWRVEVSAAARVQGIWLAESRQELEGA